MLCSEAIDDLSASAPWEVVETEMQLAANRHWVVMFHAHVPGESVSRAALERLFTLADKYHLDYVGFDELAPGPPRAGVAFAFDDNAVDAWDSVLDIVDAHHARLTFFVTRWTELTDAQHAAVHALHAAGHDIEPHSVNHIHADEYVAMNGLDAYVANEVVPSIQVLESEGFVPTTYAYPFGIHSAAMDERILQLVERVRVTPGSCPW